MPTASISDARSIMERRDISGLPVVDDDAGLLGMLTSRDIMLADAGQLVSARMTPRDRLIIAPPDVGLEPAKRLLSENRLENCRSSTMKIARSASSPPATFCPPTLRIRPTLPRTTKDGYASPQRWASSMIMLTEPECWPIPEPMPSSSTLPTETLN